MNFGWYYCRLNQVRRCVFKDRRVCGMPIVRMVDRLLQYMAHSLITERTNSGRRLSLPLTILTFLSLRSLGPGVLRPVSICSAKQRDHLFNAFGMGVCEIVVLVRILGEIKELHKG